EDILKAKKVQISGIKVALETAFASRNASSSLTSCFSGGKLVDGCGNQLPSSLNPTCSKILGNTAACECQGKKVVQKVAVKALDPAIDANGQRKASIVGCFAAGASMEAAFQAASGESDYDNKLMYFGSVDGVMAYYPGVLWARSQDYYGEKSCGADYDPRRRPWFLSGSTGPKNVVFILDSSGSMQQPVHAPRMALLKTAAKVLMDGLTQADFVSVVDFDGEARTFKDNKFMARATRSFRGEMKNFIDGLEAKGSTNYEAAFKRAFEIVDTGYASKYETGCQTVFVFLTDGKMALGADPTSMITTRKAQVKRNEMYLIIGLGSDVENDETLKNLACAAGGIFESVSDPASNNDVDVRKAESALSDALAGFSRYF
ncbi:MAG: vWA domain-containing protein, partial [Promethearchaeia archaeon]